MLGLDGDAVSRDNFPLPNLATHLDRASHNIHEGTGFAIIRGLDLNSFTPEDKLVIFLGLASYIGDIRGVQDRRGTMICMLFVRPLWFPSISLFVDISWANGLIAHITDSKLWKTVAPELRHGIHTSGPLSWHTDMSVDILALHVRALAEQGGATFLASSWTIYQELEATRPDIINILSQPTWPLQL